MKQFLKNEYGILVNSVEERTRGEMSDGYVINNKFFLKIMKEDKFSLAIVDYLDTVLSATLELSEIINLPKPIKNKDDKLKTNFNDRVAILYNYIEGEQKSLNTEQYEQLGKLLRLLHDSKLKTQLRKEDFSMPFKQELIQHLDKIPKYKEFVLKLLKELEGVNLNGDFVVCHTDCIEQNIIIHKGKVFLVDWDGICLSLKEKDLWFHSKHLKSLLKGYGKVKINQKAMDYFYKMRVLTDLHEFLIKGDFKPINEYIFCEFDKMISNKNNI